MEEDWAEGVLAEEAAVDSEEEEAVDSEGEGLEMGLVGVVLAGAAGLEAGSGVAGETAAEGATVD
jgi:hypothetical protein